MALPLANTFEGGSDGTAITTGNSGGGSGDAFGSLFVDTGGTLTYDNLRAAHGVISAECVTTGGYCFFGYTAAQVGTQTELYGRIYIYRTANPAAEHAVARLYDSGAVDCGRVSINTAGALAVRDAAGAVSDSGANVIPLNAWTRIELKLVANATTGIIEAKAFAADSTTVLTGMTVTRSNVDTRANVAALDFGQAVDADVGTFWADSLQVNSTGYPGPASNPQLLRPTVDSVVGAYTTQASGSTNLYQTIDESSPSDADYVQSETAPVSSVYRFKIQSGTDPAVSTGHAIRWRAGKLPTDGRQINGTVRIYQGGGDSAGAGTLIKTATRTNVVAFTTYEETLSGAEADAITNYADLYGEFVAAQV